MQKSVRKIHLKSFENPIKNSILQKQCMKNPSHIISKTQQNKSLFKTVSPKSHPKASENNWKNEHSLKKFGIYVSKD